jgi:hypothetical protein
MHLYGWRYESFVSVLGSNNAAVLKVAGARLSEAFGDESLRTRGHAWLRTLIEAGFPLATDREAPSVPDDGGLLTMRMETETHVVAVHSIVRVISRDEYLDLASESTDLIHPAAEGLFHELGVCGFTCSGPCDDRYWTRWAKLLDGTPLFGDDFHSPSFYSWLSNQDLAGMTSVFRAAREFQRPLPKAIAEAPEEKWEALRRAYKTSLSEGGKAAVTELARWFGQIQRAGQDAFILWS